MTRKDETAGKAIVNGPRGYRERASRCRGDGRARQVWRDSTATGKRGERAMVNRRRRRGKFGESSGHATIRRKPSASTGTDRYRSPLTYPNPAQKTETSSNPPFSFSPALSPVPPFLRFCSSASRSIFIASRFCAHFFPRLSYPPRLRYPPPLRHPSFSSPLYHRQSPA